MCELRRILLCCCSRESVVLARQCQASVILLVYGLHSDVDIAVTAARQRLARYQGDHCSRHEVGPRGAVRLL